LEQIIQSVDRAILEHEIDLNILIDGILFRKQGLIHPRIISPTYLIKNSKFIKEQVLHAEFPIAINEGKIDQLIKISKLHIAYIDRRLIYTLNCDDGVVSGIAESRKSPSAIVKHKITAIRDDLRSLIRETRTERYAE